MKKVLNVSFCDTFQKKTDESSRSVSSYERAIGTLAGYPGECVSDRAVLCSPGLERSVQSPELMMSLVPLPLPPGAGRHYHI